MAPTAQMIAIDTDDPASRIDDAERIVRRPHATGTAGMPGAHHPAADIGLQLPAVGQQRPQMWPVTYQIVDHEAAQCGRRIHHCGAETGQYLYCHALGQRPKAGDEQRIHHRLVRAQPWVLNRARACLDGKG